MIEDIYIEGWKMAGKENWVCKLNKSLYGLRQAGYYWYMCLYDEMCKAGFTRASADHSVFVKESDTGDAIVTVHVDNVAATTSNLETLACIIADLSRIIDIVDMGPIKWFLGMMVTRHNTIVPNCLHQHHPEVFPHDQLSWHLNSSGSQCGPFHCHVTYLGGSQIKNEGHPVPHWC